MFHTEDSAAGSQRRLAGCGTADGTVVAGTNALVVRSHVFGWSPQEDSFAEQVWSACTDRRPMAVDGRRHATPLLITDLAEFLAKAYHAELQGIWHIAGAERTSPFRFACELAVALGLPGPQAAMPGPATLSLSTVRRRRFAAVVRNTSWIFRCRCCAKAMQRFAAQAENGWRDRLRGEAWERHGFAAPSGLTARGHGRLRRVEPADCHSSRSANPSNRAPHKSASPLSVSARKTAPLKS